MSSTIKSSDKNAKQQREEANISDLQGADPSAQEEIYRSQSQASPNVRASRVNNRIERNSAL